MREHIPQDLIIVPDESVVALCVQWRNANNVEWKLKARYKFVFPIDYFWKRISSCFDDRYGSASLDFPTETLSTWWAGTPFLD